MMQYYSPVNGFPNAGTSFPYVPIPVQPPTPYPRIVGEGDVVSVALPDGTLQLYFVPCPRAPAYLGNNCQQCSAHTEAWFIRTIPNLFPASQPPALNQQFDTQPSSFNLFQNNALKCEEKPGYQLQFHNDQTTSSTDMHYFCRPVYPFGWNPRQSVETQVEQPIKLYEVVCCRACHCPQHRGKSDPMRSAGSSMSIDGPIDEIRNPSYGDIKRNKIRFNLDSKTEQNANTYRGTCENKCKCTVLRASGKSNQSVSEQGCQFARELVSQSTGGQANQCTSERASQSVSERGVQPASERSSQSESERASQASNCDVCCDACATTGPLTDTEYWIQGNENETGC